MADGFVALGVDPASTRSTFVGFYHGDHLVVDAKRLGKSGAPACAKAWQVTLDVVGLITSKWPDVPIKAWIESPVVGRGGVRSTMVQCYTSGAIQGALYHCGIGVDLVNVSSWKKKVVGHGHADKPTVSRFVELRWPALYREAAGSQDVADAACIAHYGQLGTE